MNLIVLMLVLTTGLSLYVDVKGRELRTRNLAVQDRLQEVLRRRQELSRMLEIAVLDRNILRTANYETVQSLFDRALSELAELDWALPFSDEIQALKDDQERLRRVEIQALDLMRTGQWTVARAVLFNPAYAQDAERVVIDTQTTVAAVAGELTAKVALFDRLRAVTLALRLLALALLLWVGAGYSRQLREQLAEQKRNQAALSATQKTLRDLTAHEQAGREAGRKRVAQEIHDELGQRLTVLRMDVALLPRAIAADPAGLLPARVTDLKVGIDGILTIVRDIAGKLRPAALEIGLAPATEALLQEFRETLGIPCELDNRLPADLVLDDVRATGVFRILQESLTNIARHAHAGRIQVSLSVKSQVLRLKVMDDGQGFTEVASGSFGLPGMRERAASLGGSLRISSEATFGTTVEARIPLGTVLSPATQTGS